MGGGMRQAGFLAAAGLYALKNNVERLKDDHKRAKQLEATLNQLTWVKGCFKVETNIVVIELQDENKRDEYIQKLAQNNIKTIAFMSKLGLCVLFSRTKLRNQSV